MESGRPFIDSIKTVVEPIASYLQFNISLHIYQAPLSLNLQEFTASRGAAIGQDTKSKVAVAIKVLLHHHNISNLLTRCAIGFLEKKHRHPNFIWSAGISR